jgi:hypothetical protein
LSAGSRQLLTLLERDHGILINCKRVRRVRQTVVPYLETALGLVPASRCHRGWNGCGRPPHWLG